MKNVGKMCELDAAIVEASTMGCSVRKRADEIQQIKTLNNLSCAEAVKRVQKQRERNRQW